MSNFDEHKQKTWSQHRKKMKKQWLGIGIPLLCLSLTLGVILCWNPSMRDTDRINDDAPVVEYDYTDHTHADAPAEPQPWEIPPQNKLMGIPGEIFTEYEGVSVQVDSLHLDWGSMVFEIWNQSGEFVHFSGHDLLYQEADQWVSCAIEGSNWQIEPMELPSYPNEATAGLSTTWKMFDFTKAGLYRYVCTFRVGEDETQYTMWAEFTLE